MLEVNRKITFVQLKDNPMIYNLTKHNNQKNVQVYLNKNVIKLRIKTTKFV